MLEKLWLWLWRRKPILAILVAVPLCVGVVAWKWNEIRVPLGRIALWVADVTGARPQDDDAVTVLNERISRAEARLRGRTTPEEREAYQAQIAAWKAERQKLTAEYLEKKSGTKAQGPTIRITYSALERRPGVSNVGFRVTTPADRLVSIEWEFNSYLIRNKEARALGHPAVHEAMTASDIVNSGRAFYLGGVVLSKASSGIYVPASLAVLAFRLKKAGWLSATMTLEPDDVFVGTIMTGIPPNAGEALLTMLSLNIGFFPLSLEDPSFSAVHVKDLTEKHGLVSVRGVLGLILNPFILSKLTASDLDVEIGGKKLSDYEVLALRAVGPQRVEPVGASTTSK